MPLRHGGIEEDRGHHSHREVPEQHQAFPAECHDRTRECRHHDRGEGEDAAVRAHQKALQPH